MYLDTLPSPRLALHNIIHTTTLSKFPHRLSSLVLGILSFLFFVIFLFLPTRGLDFVLARDAGPVAPDPIFVFGAVPHVAFFEAGGFEDVVLADRAVVVVTHARSFKVY